MVRIGDVVDCAVVALVTVACDGAAVCAVVDVCSVGGVGFAAGVDGVVCGVGVVGVLALWCCVCRALDQQVRVRLRDLQLQSHCASDSYHRRDHRRRRAPNVFDRMATMSD